MSLTAAAQEPSLRCLRARVRIAAERARKARVRYLVDASRKRRVQLTARESELDAALAELRGAQLLSDRDRNRA